MNRIAKLHNILDVRDTLKAEFGYVYERIFPFEQLDERAEFFDATYGSIVYFTDDDFIGGVRAVTGTDIEYWAVAGTRLEAGSIFTVSIAMVGGGERVEEWISGAAGIVLGNDRDVAAANCDDPLPLGRRDCRY